ncbi:MAG TPA: DUF4136 domain-containing protein [Steroidobacteraceae bacterium]|nr:DUF4136 domain-containing protein [Steroidobacteraceae bacterium]
MTLPRTRCQLAASLLLCVSGLLTACGTAPLKVHTRADPAAEFSSYRSYGFVPVVGTNYGGKTTALTVYFMQAIRQEMDSRGYRYTEESPDLLVNFNANPRAGNETTTSVSPALGYSTGYYAYRAELYGLPVVQFEDEETVSYRVGTGNIDIVDARKKMLIWEGIAEGRLTEEMLNNPGPAIAKVVAEILAQYPGKAAP